MTRDDIIRMAKSVGIDDESWQTVQALRGFADLVAAAERERLKWDGLHSCHPECDRPACVHTRKAVEAEREACAVIAFNAKTYIEAAKAIRARGQG